MEVYFFPMPPLGCSMSDIEVPVRENAAEGSAVTKSHQFSADAVGFSISVEYKPSDWVVPGNETKEYFQQVYEEHDESEALAERIYEDFAEELFPGYSNYDDLWEKIPLVVTVTSEDFHGSVSASLGRFN